MKWLVLAWGKVHSKLTYRRCVSILYIAAFFLFTIINNKCTLAYSTCIPVSIYACLLAVQRGVSIIIYWHKFFICKILFFIQTYFKVTLLTTCFNGPNVSVNVRTLTAYVCECVTKTTQFVIQNISIYALSKDRGYTNCVIRNFIFIDKVCLCNWAKWDFKLS